MIALVLSFVLALIASWYVLSPVLEGVQAQDSISNLDLELERERLFFRLEELEQEKILNRVSEEGYQISKGEIVSELSKCLEQLRPEQVNSDLENPQPLAALRQK